MSTSMADSALSLASLAVLVLLLALASLAVLVLVLALAAPSPAGDRDMVQDICVADYKSLQGLFKGSLDVGFVTTANRLFARTVFPRGLLHFQKNSCANSAAVAVAAFSSQTQGTLSVADELFGATPPLQADVLARAFQIDSGLVDSTKSKFPPN